MRKCKCRKCRPPHKRLEKQKPIPTGTLAPSLSKPQQPPPRPLPRAAARRRTGPDIDPANLGAEHRHIVEGDLRGDGRRALQRANVVRTLASGGIGVQRGARRRGAAGGTRDRAEGQRGGRLRERRHAVRPRACVRLAQLVAADGGGGGGGRARVWRRAEQEWARTRRLARSLAYVLARRLWRARVSRDDGWLRLR